MAFTMQSADSDHPQNQYTIKTKNVTYEVFPTYHKSGWICHKKVNPTINKQILRDVNCEVKPGEITAIAGRSGAGKTTLLEVLAGVISPWRLSGEVLLNDRPMNPNVFRRLSAYISQEDLLFPFLTVEETLLYSARLRIPGGLDNSKVRVQELLLELGLSHVAGERVGSSTHRGISGGEKRRVSIGVDLVHNPSVLLMDEPTSGLDSGAAFQVITMLKSMAINLDKTIVLTIHQPGFRILEVLDQIVLLSDGAVVHHGSLDSLHHRLKSMGYHIPQQVNVLEFSIDVIQNLIPDVIKTPNPNEIEQKPHSDGVNQNYDLQYANGVLSEIAILMERFAYNIFRTKAIFVVNILQSLLVGILLGTVYRHLNRFHIETQIGFFSFTLTFLLYSPSKVFPIFFEERQILMRETSTGAYRVSSYTIANTLVFVPILFIVALTYAIPTYWLVGLRFGLDGFFQFVLIVWLVILMSNSFVAFFSALVPDLITGMSSVAVLMGAFFLFSGYYIVENDIPKYWIFMYYLSLFRYPFESFLLNEFGGSKGRWRCLEPFDGGCLISAEDFLKKKNLKEDQKWFNVGMMVVFVFGYRLLSLMVLCYRSYKRRN